MEIQALFPTLVGMKQADQETISAIDREIVAQKAQLESLLRYSWGDNVLTSFELEKDILAAAKLQELKRFVEASILEFVSTTRNINDLKFVDGYTQSWINVTKKFGYQERHNHERSVEGFPISGAYYVRTNGNDGAFSVCPGDAQSKFFGNYEIRPEIGKLVLFRSEVFHRVGVNMTDSDRVSIAFNYLLAK
jgi:uncharacterized protein (TIGR02466 family)